MIWPAEGLMLLPEKIDRVRKTETCLVGNVKAFSPEQHARLFRDWDGLKDREIKFRLAPGYPVISRNSILTDRFVQKASTLNVCLAKLRIPGNSTSDSN